MQNSMCNLILNLVIHHTKFNAQPIINHAWLMVAWYLIAKGYIADIIAFPPVPRHIVTPLPKDRTVVGKTCNFRVKKEYVTKDWLNKHYIKINWY